MELPVKDTENCNGNKEDQFFSLFTGGNLKENFEFDQLTSDLYDHVCPILFPCLFRQEK